MKKIFLLIALLLTGMSAEVMPLTDANYKESIQKKEQVVLLFSAPWCGACRSMKPTYKKFAKEHHEKTLFTEINIDENKALTSLYKIEGLPTLIVLEKGKETKRLSGSLQMNELELFVYTKKVMQEYVKQCNNGKSKACIALGGLYEEGHIEKQDYEKALIFYEKACVLKNAEGCMYLAYMYDEAMGVKQDYVMAKKYYIKACEGGNIIACRFLGYMYDEGLGTQKDYKKAHELYLKSCMGEDEYACYNLGYMYRKGNGVRKDLEKAFSFYKRACNLGNDDACDEVNKLKK